MTIIYRVIPVLIWFFLASGRQVQTYLDLSQGNQFAQGNLKAFGNVLLATLRSYSGGPRVSWHNNRRSRSSMSEASGDTILLRAARGEEVEHTPIWMMRQAGRHMKAYRDTYESLSFREKSENANNSRDITLQPFDRYGTDGAILFSDILTPLPAMGVNFDISKEMGITIDPIIRTREAFKTMTEKSSFDPGTDLPFVGAALRDLHEYIVPKGGTLLGFIGLPFTLMTFLIEGTVGTRAGFPETTKLRKSDPELCHDIASLLARKIAQYAVYQIDSGAQVVMLFDSFAGHLTPEEFDEFAAPYEKMVVNGIREQRPGVPIGIYMAPGEYSKNGQLLTRLASSGANIVGVDDTIDLAEARRILADGGYPEVVLQGNMNPDILRDGPKEKIKAEAERILKMTGKRGIMNLGRPIDPTTPEENVEFFVNVVQQFKH
jgi:uroporphyrinogen decarboxylase